MTFNSQPSGTVDAMNEALCEELLLMEKEDLRVREQLAEAGVLYDGYHPEMERVHRQNATRLQKILEEVGWPGSGMVGEAGARAAWLVIQHAIGEPAFQRYCLQLLQEAAGREEIPPWQPAMLEDRIRMFEGKKQRYGTQLEADEAGNPQPYPVEDAEHLDERRLAVGLEPMAERLARAGRMPVPKDPDQFKQEYEAWLRRVGWRT